MARSAREALAAMVALEMLTQGTFFDSQSLRGTFPRMLVTRTLRALMDSHVVTKSMPRRKYLFASEFKDIVKGEITRGMPRGVFVRYPDFAVFDVSGMECWTEDEFETYVKRLRKHWLARSGRDGPEGRKAGDASRVVP
jgi:hypothetical protein